MKISFSFIMAFFSLRFIGLKDYSKPSKQKNFTKFYLTIMYKIRNTSVTVI